MKRSMSKKVDVYIIVFFGIFAIMTMFVCLYQVNLEAKKMLFILPLGYVIASIVFCCNYSNLVDNVPKLIIISLYFVRLVVLPFLYTFNIDIQLFEGKSSVSSHFTQACILMTYEYFIVQLSIYCYEHWKRQKRFIFSNITLEVDISKILIGFISLYVIAIAVFLPQYASNFKTIFELDNADFTVASVGAEYSVGTFGRVLKTLFSMFVQLFRVLFPAMLISRAFEHNPNSSISTFILAFGCFLQFMFLTSTFAEAIVACLTVVLFYIKLYPNRRKKTFLFLGCSTLGMVFLYFIVRYLINDASSMYSKKNGAIGYATQIINAYFTGVDNVAAMFNVPSGYESESFCAGVLGAIPFNSTLFGNHGNKLQHYFNVFNNAYGQIPPTIGAGYYYFGTIISPIISGLFVLMSMKYYKAANKEDASLKYVAHIFCSIVFALGTVMYSPSITLAWYFSWGIPLLIITYFTGVNKGRKNEKSI